MKNVLLKSFLLVFVLLNIIFLSEIMFGFYTISELLWLACNFDVMCIVLGVLYVVLFAVSLIHILLKKRKQELIKTVEFKAPDDMTPIEVGFLVDNSLDGSDVSAMFVYWASKKYIEISGEKDNQKLIRLVDKLPDECKNYEKFLFASIFRKQKEKEVAVSIIPKLLNDERTAKISTEIHNTVGKKYFDLKATWLRQFYVILYAVLFYLTVCYFRLEYFVDVVPIIEIFAVISTSLFVVFADWIISSYDNRFKNNALKSNLVALILFAIFMSIVAGLCVYFFLTDFYQVIFLLVVCVLMLIFCLLVRFINIYSAEGSAQLGKILGFKEFIKVAEKERLEMLVEENPEIFYEILPYAQVLGVSDKWIENLDVIKVDRPDLVTDNLLTNILIYNLIFKNNYLSHIVFLNGSAMVIRAIAKGAISLGSNNGSGGSKGGSNFGGFRRR